MEKRIQILEKLYKDAIESKALLKAKFRRHRSRHRTRCELYEAEVAKLQAQLQHSQAQRDELQKRLAEAQEKKKRETEQHQQNKRKIAGTFFEPVREKKAREDLRGFSCQACAEFYKVAGEPAQMPDCTHHTTAKGYASRHRHPCTPPKTPPGFWDLSVGSPEPPSQ
jgi:DNA endonuclease activator SAE2/CtIP C-terminus